MPSRVSLCAERGPENNEVLGDGGVDDVHSAHGAAGVVEDPFFVSVYVIGVRLGEVRGDVVDYGAGVVAVGGDGGLREGVELGGVEDVEFPEVAFEHVHDGCDGCHYGAQEGEDAHGGLT